ncbi:MAG: YitT family protein [Muribaculaceae bacterium]|nr:YitT family protein [Muribaculaceae bacterium]
MTDFNKLLRNSVKDYVMIVLGLSFYSFGFSAFVLPEKIVTGGVVGLASLFLYAFDWNVAVTNYAINAILLAIAFRSIGRQFVIRTIIGATLVSATLAIFKPMFTAPIVEGQPFMNVIIGALMSGIGIGTAFAHNGSSAGTDIIAAMVSKHSTISFGRIMLYCDIVIISSSYLLFHSVEKIVYGIVFLFILSFVSDYVINNNRQAVQFLIFSKKWEDIANAINNVAHRGCTLIHGTGWYTKHDVKILMVMCRRHQSVDIFRIVKAVDKNAFISQTNVKGVYGEGFDEVKVRLQKYQPKETDEVNRELTSSELNDHIRT